MAGPRPHQVHFSIPLLISGKPPTKLEINPEIIKIFGLTPSNSVQSHHFGRFTQVSGRFSTYIHNKAPGLKV